MGQSNPRSVLGSPGPEMVLSIHGARAGIYHYALPFKWAMDASLTADGGTFHNTKRGVYSPNSVPQALELILFSCGPCAKVDVYLGARTAPKGADGYFLNNSDALQADWLATCTRVTLRDGAPSRLLIPLDVRGRTLRDLDEYLRGIGFRFCLCENTFLEVVYRLWTVNGGGCTIFGSGVGPAPGGDGWQALPAPPRINPALPVTPATPARPASGGAEGRQNFAIRN